MNTDPVLDDDATENLEFPRPYALGYELADDR